jgi:hypothetical protein
MSELVLITDLMMMVIDVIDVIDPQLNSIKHQERGCGRQDS